MDDLKSTMQWYIDNSGGFCLIPSDVTDDDDGGEDKCEDKYEFKKCKKLFLKGKCSMEKVSKNCLKTCQICNGGDEEPCVNLWSQNYCKKLKKKGKCTKKMVKTYCMKRCEACLTGKHEIEY